MSIYVHKNPGSIDYNTCLYAFMYSCYFPTSAYEAVVSKDFWIRVPAVRTRVSNGRDSFVCLNSKVERTALMLVAEDDGLVIKTGKVQPYRQVPAKILEDIKKEAIDIPEYERFNNESWEYNLMFNKDMVRHRWSQRHDWVKENEKGLVPMSPVNKTYKKARRASMPPPCKNCGKHKRTSVTI